MSNAVPATRGQNNAELVQVSTVWVENLTPYPTRCHRPIGSFVLEPTGYTGSIQEISRDLANDAYVRRAIRRNKIRFIEDGDEALDRIENLIPLDGTDEIDASEHVRKQLAAGISEQSGRFLKDLPDDAEPKRPQTSDEIWGQPSRLRSKDSSALPSTPPKGVNAPIIDRPILDGSVVQEKVYYEGSD